MRRPVYGEDCRRSVKINLLFSDVFENKRNKNLDRYQAEDHKAIQDLDTAPSAVFNTFALHVSEVREPRNLIDDWEELSQEEIELLYTQSKSLIREVPLSL